MKGESMNKKGNVRTINDERMYDYFHNLLENMPVFLKAGKKKEKKGRAWQKSLTSYNFEQIYETRKAIYSEVEVCNELCMMDDILHIFQEYFHIPGIDRLLVNNYGALENDIFLEYDGVYFNRDNVLDGVDNRIYWYDFDTGECEYLFDNG